MGLIKEFKEFAMRGSVVDLAVGVVIGAAFGKIVSSLVGDIIMPLVGAITGGGQFTNEFLWLGGGDKPATLEAAKTAGGAYIAWGSFLQTSIDFLIVAFAIFMAIKAMNTLTKTKETPPSAPPAPPEDILLLREIRDSLKNR